MSAARCAALLVVLLLDVGSLAHPQQLKSSAASQYYVPGEAAGSNERQSSPLDVARLQAALNAAVKRHVGKFLRIGRSSSGDGDGGSVIRPDEAFWSLHDAPVSPRRLAFLSRRHRSSTLSSDDARLRQPNRSALVRRGVLSPVRRRNTSPDDSSTADELAARRKRQSSRHVRFVRIGKTNAQRRSTRKRTDDDVNVYRRSLENRFVRIGK